ncbi:MAG: LysM peptidoglycan-binding domain-containing protein [Planctomycetia bacterium]|nr:MAG: LysM peptidoglycan-binding domain-containing protein [Planctomycetia bacterium]
MSRVIALSVLLSVIALSGCGDQNKQEPQPSQPQATSPPPAEPYPPVDSDSMGLGTPSSSSRYSDAMEPTDDSSYPPTESGTLERAPSRSKPAAKPAARARTHTVKRGETLAGISKRYYGDETKWKRIQSANKAKVPDPKKLKVGTVLTIP